MFVSPQNSHVTAPNPKVTVFSHRDFMGVIKIKWGHKDGIGLASVSMSCQALHSGSALYANLVLGDVLVSCGGQGPWGGLTLFGGFFVPMGFFPRKASFWRKILFCESGASHLWVLCKQGVWWDGLTPRDNLSMAYLLRMPIGRLVNSYWANALEVFVSPRQIWSSCCWVLCCKPRNLEI